MCNYCGCREFPLIGRLTADHEQIAEAAERLRAAIASAADGVNRWPRGDIGAATFDIRFR